MVKKCPECGGGLKETDTICPECGVELEVEEEVEYECPECGAGITETDTVCPNCGVELEIEEETDEEDLIDSSLGESEDLTEEAYDDEV